MLTCKNHQKLISYTLQGTNISTKNSILKMIFLFPRWDMLVPWNDLKSSYSPTVRHTNTTKTTQTITHSNPDFARNLLRHVWSKLSRPHLTCNAQDSRNAILSNPCWIGRGKGKLNVPWEDCNDHLTEENH